MKSKKKWWRLEAGREKRMEKKGEENANGTRENAGKRERKR